MIMKTIFPLLWIALTVSTSIVKSNTTESRALEENSVSVSNSTRSKSWKESALSDSKCKVPRSSEENLRTVSNNSEAVRLEDNCTFGNEVGEDITRPKRAFRLPKFFLKLGQRIKKGIKKLLSTILIKLRIRRKKGCPEGFGLPTRPPPRRGTLKTLLLGRPIIRPGRPYRFPFPGPHPFDPRRPRRGKKPTMKPGIRRRLFPSRPILKKKKNKLIKIPQAA